ncbi:unnamed protein product [Rotaria sp. Silwood1]|nr:unnamed protein product [Rotaria sp. Silwood1]CAF1510632.1 unnamed protein product [Rotaria sp. Silwood1]CAF1513033.1 unnamed protein product [Rotaria sp. Silwood1]CAF3586318.1 unnamed protein product [Rotaria sp. Silwood1]CAF3616443.1 unnamed protein product [Rotaria sp. Silwood1]
MGYDDFLFDIVYTYVNGSNEQYIREKVYWFSIHQPLLGSNRLKEHHSISSSLSKDNNELCFSLRSIEKYMPSFHGHIYVVTDQIPNWLNISKSQSQLRVISTKEIMDHIYLPTFNSHAIEANIHKIPHLKEFYLYFNDDYILGRPVLIEDFFINGRCPVIYGDDRFTSNTNVTLNIHKKAMLNTNFLLDNLSSSTNANESDRHFLPHAPHPIRKSIAEEVWFSKFTDIHREQSSHRFRDMNDVHPTYFITRYLIEQSNVCVEQRRMKSACPSDGDFCNQVLTNNFKKVKEFFNELRRRSQMPKFLSINDRTSSNHTNQALIHEKFQRFLKEMFPQKSKFESRDCTM